MSVKELIRAVFAALGQLIGVTVKAIDVIDDVVTTVGAETKQIRNESIKELLQNKTCFTDEEIEEAKKQMNQRF